MIKILFLYDAIALLGGIERVVVEKFNKLSEDPNYKVYIVTTNQGSHPISYPLMSNICHIDLDIRFHTQYQYGAMKRFFIRRKMIHDFRQRLQKLIDEINPDIIDVTTTCFFDIVLSLKTTAKIVVESHSVKNELTMTKSCDVKSKVKTYIEKKKQKCICQCDALVTLTEASAKEWNKIHSAIIIPNIVNVLNHEKSNHRNKKFISVGRLEYEKGFDLLLKAWKIFISNNKEWTLDIYGDGSLRNLLIKQTVELGITDSVIIHNPIRNIFLKYAEASAFVLPSRAEGFGLVLVEAMSCGLPCIAFDCPYGPKEIITNKVNGVLVENSNYKKLAYEMLRMAENQECIENFGEKAFIESKKYAVDLIINRWKSLYEGLVMSN